MSDAVSGVTSPDTALALIRRWRDASPDAVAVSGADGVLTYRELHDRVDRLAALLRARGVGPEVPVGLCLERCPGMVVALLAVWRAGGAYVPLDPGFPEERLRFMREDAGIRLVLAGQGVESRLLDGVPDVVELSQDGVPVAGGASGDGGVPADGPAGDAVGDAVGDLAYLMYTSGSTGRPKGVAVPHGAVVNLLESFASLLELTPRDAWLAVTTLSFDISVLELLLPLACGARVVVASGHETADGRALRSRAVAEAVTIMQATPASWRILLESGGVPENVATRLCGGEALPRDLADALLEGSAGLWNVYGPTETTVWSTAGRVGPSPAAVDLGEPIGNTTVHILGPDGRPVPPGEAGELHIGGAGLARGYRGMPGQTAARFLPDPFSAVPGARLYATGDLARIENGRLCYLGRADQQVKVRGFRIELGEIETVLRAAPEVADAAVGVCDGPDGLPRLVAYVVRAAGEPEETDLWPSLRDRLRRDVPEYMVPAHLVMLDALPLTPNGKLDRKALPVPEWTRARSRPYRQPSTPLEQDLAAMWGEVLGIAEPVGVDDDFFELGGHSLTATQIIARIQARFATSVPIVVLFENPTVAELAAAMDRLDDDDLDLTEIAALRDELDGLSAEDLAAVLDEMASDR
ncbi:non-ribosomal peptide synthetase [Microbispora rosea]|uniref:non-ribosomal peptide synthetase n=1 Tax=Microbispora rosea TaxID=58117 RepID=UPI0034268D19